MDKIFDTTRREIEVNIDRLEVYLCNSGTIRVPPDLELSPEKVFALSHLKFLCLSLFPLSCENR
jgi:hypothetical protein